MIYAHSSKEKNAFCALSLPSFFVSFRKDKRTRLRLLLLLLQQQLSSWENERKKERKKGRKKERKKEIKKEREKENTARQAERSLTAPCQQNAHTTGS